MTQRATTRLRRRERIVRARQSVATLRRMATRISRFGGSTAPTTSPNSQGAA